MQVLSVADLAEVLVCPLCRGGALHARSEALHCAKCDRTYATTDRGVVSFLIDEQLVEQHRREIEGNTFPADYEERFIHKEDWHPLLTQQMEWAIDVVARMLPEKRDLCVLGAGGGFDLRLLLRRRSFDRVFASDISPASTALIARALAEYSGQLGLFVSEFGRCPMPKRSGMLGLVFQALHHATDSHEALATLLDHNFDDLVIVEPCTNPPLGVLARFDLVQRVEYTGTRPDWISLPRVQTLAEQRGYRVATQTWWEIPPYVVHWLRNHENLWKPCYQMFDVVSRATNKIKFGSMAAVHLTRS